MYRRAKMVPECQLLIWALPTPTNMACVSIAILVELPRKAESYFQHTESTFSSDFQYAENMIPLFLVILKFCSTKHLFNYSCPEYKPRLYYINAKVDQGLLMRNVNIYKNCPHSSLHANDIVYLLYSFSSSPLVKIIELFLQVCWECILELCQYCNEVYTKKSLTVWLMSKTIQKIVLVITSTETMEDVERWQFDVDCDTKASQDPRFVLLPFYELLMY